MGFRDVGGIAEDNMYACGQGGDLWHYDGTQWQQLDSPTNEDLTCLHCTEDGVVYIGTEKGHVIKGKKGHWEILQSSTTFRDSINDIISFKGCVYVIASAFSGMYICSENKLDVLPDFPTTIKNLSTVNSLEESFNSSLKCPTGAHTLSTDGNLLLVAGHEEVISFDGEIWSVFYSSHDSVMDEK